MQCIINLERIVLSTGLVFFTSCSGTKEKSITDTLPNIIYILSDDLGYGDLGCYGQEKILTPSLDNLAREGMLFTRHYAGSTVCAPSRCVLLTGEHTGNSWIRGNKGVKPMGQFPLADSIVTIAELLKEIGYQTGAIGKWGLGGSQSEGDPLNQGFNFFYGYKCQSHAHNYYPEFIFRNHDTVRLRNILPKPVNSNQTGYAEVRLDYTPDLFLKQSLEFINHNQDGPFFLYLALTPPHVNNEAPRGKGMEVPEQGQYSDKDWPDIEKDKASMITRMDRDIGKIVEEIVSLGLEKKTLILFSSDNGPHKEGGVNPDFLISSGGLRGTKRDLYEGGIRVPLIAWWPGTIKEGQISNHVSAFWDFFPTVCEITGIKVPENVDGISFLNELKGEAQKKHEFLYWEYPVNNGKMAGLYQDWKLVFPNLRVNPDSVELYNLGEDPFESINLVAEHPEIVQHMKESMLSAHSPNAHFPMPALPKFFDEIQK